MKQLKLLILFISITISASANIDTLLVNGGKWSNASDWKSNTIPADGDTLRILKNYTLVVEGNIKNVGNITILVEGSLDLNNGKLDLDNESAVYLFSPSAQLISEKGTPADKIIIGGVEKYNGSIGTITGPALADKTTGAATSSTAAFTLLTDFTLLPVVFTSFTVSKAANGVAVQWTTAQEINADAFLVERSEDGRNWRTMGSVKAAGNSTNTQNYLYTDRTAVNKIAYYRIRQVDLDGKFTFSEIKAITNQANAAGAPNISIIIANNNVIINCTKQLKGTVVVKLISFNGQVLTRQTYSHSSRQFVLNIPMSINKGNYIVFISNNLDFTVSKQIAL